MNRIKYLLESMCETHGKVFDLITVYWVPVNSILPHSIKIRNNDTVPILKLLSEERDKLNMYSDKEQGIKTTQSVLFAVAWPWLPPSISRVALPTPLVIVAR